MRKFIVCWLLCLSVSVLANEEASNTITVNGQGKVSAAPDLLKFNISVVEKGRDSVQLSDLANAKTDKIINLLVDAGIESKDITAMSVSLHPWYERKTNVQKGFTFTRAIDVTLRDFTLYPKLLNEMMENKVSSINGVRYLVEDQQGIYLQALSFAVADAKRRARKLALSLGVDVGESIKIVETSNYNSFPVPNRRSLSMVAESSQYLPGQNDVTASVLVTFKIKN